MPKIGTKTSVTSLWSSVYIIYTDHMFLRIALPFPGLWEDGWAFLRGREAAGTTTFPHQVIPSGIQVLLREIKMLVTLREDPVPFLEVLLHSHLASRTCACEWLQLSCSLSGFHCVLVKDTSEQTRLLRYRGHDRPLTSQRDCLQRA